MTTIAQVSQALRYVLTTVADEGAGRTGCIQRQRKLSGATFVQALVFAWLANPAATAEERAQVAGARGTAISAYGLDKRCTEQAADCLHQILAAAVQQVVAADPVAVPLLQRFSAVELYDGSVLTLPDALREEWPGCGGSAPSGATLKIGVRLDLLSGQLHGPVLGAGRDNDRTLPLAATALLPGGLRLADLGFFELGLFRLIAEQGGYWLSRLHATTAVYDQTGTRVEVLTLLQQAASGQLDCRSCWEPTPACRPAAWQCASRQTWPSSAVGSCGRQRPSMAVRSVPRAWPGLTGRSSSRMCPRRC